MRDMQKARGHTKKFIAAAIGLMLAGPGGAAVIYTAPWNSNEAPNGNYQLTVTDAGSTFNWSLTVNPWNAEALGLFVDFGNVATPNSFTISNVTTTPTSGGTVALFATNTTSDSCGEGCNLNGLNPPLAVPDAEWELVFRLGAQGSDGIQTWSFTTPDFGLTEAAFGLVGIRAQQLCDSGTLPDGNCGNSDKAYGYPDGPPGQVPEPGTLALMGLAFFALVGLRRKRAA